MKRDFDVMVIGSGPGGEGAAMKLSKEGKRVAMVERFPRVGGNCTHRGTIPSKMLRHAVQRLSQGSDAQKVKYPDLLKLAQGVITRQVDLRQGFYDRNDVTLIHGRASFSDANTLRIHTDTGEESYTADHFIIATGARSYHPADIDFKHPRILDSDTILQLKDTPKIMTIYGAGVIGCEYATIFKRMGMKVNLINTRPQLLSFLDDEIIDALAYHLRENGVILRHNEEYERVEADDHGVRVYLKSNKVVISDVLLWCQGRTGNSDGMGLGELGVVLDSKGNIKVNEFYQTALPHIYAVGDITGPPSLASAAYDQGRYAATHAATGTSPILNIADIPTGIYTIPEISSIGKTEKELTDLKVPYEVGHSHFRHLARAQITGIDVGMLKILFHRETLEILGIHCFGNQASEIVHIGQAIMAQKGEANTLMYFVNTTFNYPTMAEAYRVAALNGLNRIR